MKLSWREDPRIDPREEQWHFADTDRQYDALMALLTGDGVVDSAPVKREREVRPKTQRDLDRDEMDPVEFEKKYDWDNFSGNDLDRPDVEWVPTHHLKQFMEYDRKPGGAHATGSPERYNALMEHIKLHGFKNPIMLDYNQNLGMAHMSEGNHRTQIALDAGIESMPVRVYRSRRQSPTQIPVDLKPEPAWADAYDPSGYHVPEMMKPSHIGLPTVPPPGTMAEDESWNLPSSSTTATS